MKSVAAHKSPSSICVFVRGSSIWRTPATTLKCCAINVCTKALPIKPVAPVTKTFVMINRALLKQ
ncbi:hypothetical protein BMETH_1267_2 [methanotrophic bacterial endosymbiont of Bathymodiolus sp.]|nr:hypothetical protein BMETH_1267_2 [methanotrophic bacterial endosymbiont of Bathymodiolus sp.]